MKRLLALAFILAHAVAAYGQGELSPVARFQFTNNNGQNCNSCKLYTYAAGTLTALDTYSDSALMTANQNPIIMNSSGRPSYMGSEIPIYLGVASYKFILKTSADVTIWTQDNVFNLAQLQTLTFATRLDDKVCHASQYSGANAGAKIAACVAALPSTGGTIDARGFEGAQTIGTDPFAGTSKPILLLVGAATFTTTATINVPPSGGISGLGIQSKFTASGLSGELVRLSSDSSYIENVWLHGPGQDPNTVDGRRGIWVGCSVSPHSSPCTPTIYNRVENVVIDAFTGNGISGEYTQAVISKNLIYNTTDAGIFVTTTSTNNLVQGNTIRTSRYACIDVNGSYNRVTENFLSTCGGGSVDTVAWHGVLIASVSSTTPAHGNIVSLNTAENNLECGFTLIGLVTAGTVPAYGNIFEGNIATGHTNTAGGATQFPGGFCIFNGDATIVSNNFSRANRDNFIVSGYGEVTNSGITKVVNNQSLSATRYGFYFVHTPLISGAGDFPPYSSDVRGNTDTSAAVTAYRFEPRAAGAINWRYYTIKDNKCFDPGTGYCFENTQPTILTNWDFQGNFGIDYAVGQYQSGFVAAGLTVNSATPSVANRTVAITNNNMPTTYTNFTDGYQGQTIQIFIRDAGNSTFDFSANATMVGNNGSDFVSANGDVVACTLDVTVWYCSIILG